MGTLSLFLININKSGKQKIQQNKFRSQYFLMKLNYSWHHLETIVLRASAIPNYEYLLLKMTLGKCYYFESNCNTSVILQKINI